MPRTANQHRACHRMRPVSRSPVATRREAGIKWWLGAQLLLELLRRTNGWDILLQVQGGLGW